MPLLERVRFLSIFASNLDEFFMVRVAGLIRRMATGLPVEGASGLSPGQMLANTLETARELSLRHAACFQQRGPARRWPTRASRSCAGRNCPPPSRRTCTGCSASGSTRC